MSKEQDGNQKILRIDKKFDPNKMNFDKFSKNYNTSFGNNNNFFQSTTNYVDNKLKFEQKTPIPKEEKENTKNIEQRHLNKNQQEILLKNKIFYENVVHKGMESIIHDNKNINQSSVEHNDFNSINIKDVEVNTYYRRKKNNFIHNERPQVKRDYTKNKVKKKTDRSSYIIKLDESILLSDLSSALNIKLNSLQKFCNKYNIVIPENKLIDADVAEFIIDHYGANFIKINQTQKEDNFYKKLEENYNTEEITRSPIVTIMGHIDHGKTSLLDALRNTNLVKKESGGITQHINGYQINYKENKITFLDTPGHAAFSQIRYRGVRIVDIAIIVVAADDGIMPQTIEAIKHAKSVNLPIIIAINKIDSPNKNIKKIKEDLLTYEVILEEFGGDVMHVEISAKNKTNLSDLLDSILLQSEIIELKTKKTGPGFGFVVDVQIDKFNGIGTSIIVHSGNFVVGNFVVCGSKSGKIKILLDENGNRIKEANPSQPVQIFGLDGVVSAGLRIDVVKNESDAEEIIEFRKEEEKRKDLKAKSFLKVPKFNIIDETAKEIINLIIKADVQGSLDAIKQSISELNDKYLKVEIKIISSKIGTISDSDINLAETTKSRIIGFNVDLLSKNLSQKLKEKAVDFKKYDIIYNLIDDLEGIMKKDEEDELDRKIIATAEVRSIFILSNKSRIAGCKVKDGTVEKKFTVSVIRNGNIIYETSIKNLKRFKDEVKEVKAGSDCGILLDDYDLVQVDDILEFYQKNK